MSWIKKSNADMVIEPFCKEKLLEDIKDLISADYSMWKIVQNSDVYPIDFLLIKSIPLEVPIAPTANPFNHYNKLQTKIYQIVLGIGVYSSHDILPENLSIDYMTKCIIVDSIKPVIRLLKEY